MKKKKPTRKMIQLKNKTISKSRTKDGSVRRTLSVGNFTYLGILSKGQIFVSVLALLWSSYWLFKNPSILLRVFIRFSDTRNLQSLCQGSCLNSSTATSDLQWATLSIQHSRTCDRDAVRTGAPWVLLCIVLALMQSRIRVDTILLYYKYVTIFMSLF